MRIADICPTCATYVNATCIIYDGSYLSTIKASPLESLDEILQGINDAIPAVSSPNLTPIPAFFGQFLVNSSNSGLYIGLSNTVPNWGFVGTIVTTTTTSTTIAPTTTTTTTP